MCFNKGLLNALMVCVAMLTWVGLPAQAQEYAINEGQGTISHVDIGKSEVIIDGLLYTPGYDINVQIAGSYGAFTMLQSGMKVKFAYRVKSGSDRELVTVEELPRGMPVDEA